MPRHSPNMGASALANCRDCRRKWFYQYVERVEVPKSKSLIDGIAVHDILEQYLRDGDELPAGRHGAIAKAGVGFLPAVGSVGVEAWVGKVLRCGPLAFKGKVDMFELDGLDIPNAGRDGLPTAFVVDRSGLIAWIGYPNAVLDAVLAELVGGTFDLELAKKVARIDRLAEQAAMFG